MRAKLLILFPLICLTALAANSLSRQERRDGFQRLFDGKSLRNWHSIRQRPDAGRWKVHKGILSWDKGGSWLATDHTYYDFVLRLEYRTGPGSNSGIFLRSASTGNPAFSGMELQILGDHGKAPDVHSTGSLYGAVKPARNPARPDGEWNQVEVSVIERRLKATWNGEPLLDVDLDDPGYAQAQNGALSERAAFGHVGLQAYSTGAPVEFRNLRIRVVRIGPEFFPIKHAD